MQVRCDGLCGPQPIQRSARTDSVFFYHRPGLGGLLYRHEANQLWLQHTPLVTAVAVAISVIIAAIAGLLGFFIFRRSRFAIVAMLVFVVILQLYTWLVAHSLTGTLPSIIIVAFLLRGGRRIFQDYAERELGSPKKA